MDSGEDKNKIQNAGMIIGFDSIVDEMEIKTDGNSQDAKNSPNEEISKKHGRHRRDEDGNANCETLINIQRHQHTHGCQSGNRHKKKPEKKRSCSRVDFSCDGLSSSPSSSSSSSSEDEIAKQIENVTLSASSLTNSSECVGGRNNSTLLHDLISSITPPPPLPSSYQQQPQTPPYEQQLVVRQQEIVPVPRRFLWCTCEPDDMKVCQAFKRIDLQEPAGVPMFVNITAFTISENMFSIEDLSLIAAAKVVRPLLEPEGFIETLRNMSYPLNFAICGPHGSGKRSAMKALCSMCNICMVTIDRERYEYRYLQMAAQYANVQRPFMMYLDGLDELLQNPDFEREFESVILSDKMFVGGWDNVWLVAGFSEKNAHLIHVLSRMCNYDNVVCMNAPSDEKLVDLLIKYIDQHNIKIIPEPGAVINNPPLTDRQWAELRAAMENTTPSSIIKFADRIISSALDHTPLEYLAAIGKNRLVLSTSQTPPVQQQQQQQQHKLLLVKEVPTRGCSTPLAMSNRSINAIPQNMSLNNLLNDLANPPSSTAATPATDVIRGPSINWERDARPKYQVIQPSDSSSGGVRRVIPNTSNDHYYTKQGLELPIW